MIAKKEGHSPANLTRPTSKRCSPPTCSPERVLADLPLSLLDSIVKAGIHRLEGIIVTPNVTSMVIEEELEMIRIERLAPGQTRLVILPRSVRLPDERDEKPQQLPAVAELRDHACGRRTEGPLRLHRDR